MKTVSLPARVLAAALAAIVISLPVVQAEPKVRLDVLGTYATGVFDGAAGDLGPEGIHFIPADKSPIGDPLIAVANEISGTTRVYSFSQVRR